MKRIRIISAFLGVAMFLFGILKFIQPFKGWYAAQIAGSGLGSIAYTSGIAGELLSGILFLLFLAAGRGTHAVKVLLPASLAVIVMMLVAVYVHAQPGVPADVLPLKIKAPYIPLVFLLLAVVNILLLLRQGSAPGLSNRVPEAD